MFKGGDLSKFATAYMVYNKGLKSSWANNKSKRDILLEQVKGSRADVHTDGRTLVFSLPEVIHVFGLTPRIDKICDIQLPLVSGSFVWSVTDTKTIVSTRGSAIRVYRKSKLGYDQETVVGLKEGRISTTHDDGSTLCCLCLVAGVAWIYEEGTNHLYLYDVAGKRLLRELRHSSYLTVNTHSEDKMFLAMEEKILCYSHDGILELIVPLPGVLYLSVSDPSTAGRLLSLDGLTEGRASLALGNSLLVSVALPPG